jgi:DNA modification methylase
MLDLNYRDYLPEPVRDMSGEQTELPAVAKNPDWMARMEEAVKTLPSRHDLYFGDSRSAGFWSKENVHLVVTSPPYWTLKEYHTSDGQLGSIEDYESFLEELDLVWARCLEALVPGGRVVCVAGDVCLSRRKNKGRHAVIPLHSSIQERARALGFDNLAPIIWSKIGNAAYEAEGCGGGFLGKPYEPNAVIKNDIEYILMFRKPGGYRSISLERRFLSLISDANHKKWFQQIWAGLTGASTKHHPAPYPLELAERLVRMFSFVGDTVLDPFMGTGTTNAAAAKWGRNSVGCEVDKQYFALACNRMDTVCGDMFSKIFVNIHKNT